MAANSDPLDFPPTLTMSEERNSITLECWQDVRLSDIWIPSRLLPSRKELSDTWVNKGIFHTLNEVDTKQHLDSFSVYSDTEDDEIFMSDSDEDILDSYMSNLKEIENSAREISVPTDSSIYTCSNYTEKDKIDQSNHVNTQYENITRKDTSNLKAMPSLNNLCSIGNEVTSNDMRSHLKEKIKTEHSKDSNSAIEIGMNNELKIPQVLFTSLNHKFNTFDSEESNKIIHKDNFQTLNKEQNGITSHISEVYINYVKNKDGFLSEQKNVKSDQKKNIKTPKLVSFSERKNEYYHDNEYYQNTCCNDYFQKVLSQKNKNDDIHIRNTAEIPKLTGKELFIHSEKLEEKNTRESYPKHVNEIVMSSNEIHKIENVDNNNEAAMSDILETEHKLGKCVIENIPNEISRNDIYSFLSTYGEIKKFSLEADGEFLKVFAELDFTCDIDWVIECLNESEPFGASTKPLKCYKQQ